MSAQEPGTDRPAQTPPGPSLATVSWSLCALAFVAGGVALLIRGDIGYAIVTLVIALGAVINVLP